MIAETHKIISIVEYNKPLNGYAKGVKVLINDREIVIVLDPSLDPNEMKVIWDDREGYENGLADILFFDETRYWGRVLKLYTNSNWVKPIPKFDTRDARKVFEQINQVM